VQEKASPRVSGARLGCWPSRSPGSNYSMLAMLLNADERFAKLRLVAEAARAIWG
jgi:hypothetical protein